MITLDQWQRWGDRLTSLLALPERVHRIVNAEIAQSVQHIWRDKYNDTRPQDSINNTRLWCHVPTGDNLQKREVAAIAAVDAAHDAGGVSIFAATTHACYAAYAAGIASPASTAAYAASAAGYDASTYVSSCYTAASTIAYYSELQRSWAYSHAVYLSTLGDWDEAWSTSDVRAIAASIYKTPGATPLDRTPFRLLADALEDAGCWDATIIDRLRGDDSVLTRADLAVRMPLGIN